MTWPLVFVAERPTREQRKPGMYWFATPEWAESGFMSPNYISDWKGKRLPIVIACPDGSTWCPDECPGWGANTDVGWKVTGELPRITAHPSIGKAGYHGWLRDGVLSDDLEGRTYGETP